MAPVLLIVGASRLIYLRRKASYIPSRPAEKLQFKIYMRLELEQNHTHLGFAGEVAPDTAAGDRTAEAAHHLREGIRAAQTGNRGAARTALLQAAQLDPQSESAWMWLSSISEYPEELLAFLTNVLEINPLNARALEWSTATKTLLAKNLVQRGIDAAEAGQNDLAAQHFNQALEYDEKNSMAWLWLASMCESTEGKLSYLEKVLEFDPENETAKAGHQAAKNSIREGLLAEARSAAVSGNSASANELLDAVIAEEPDAEDAWVLKSHIAVGFDEKIVAFRRVLEINPENNVARAGLESLTAIMDAVGAAAPAVAEPVAAAEPEQAAEVEPESFTAPAFEEEYQEEGIFDAPVADESPFESPALTEAAAETELSETAEPPFDSFAKEPVVDHNGTMLMTTSDLGFVLDDVVEVTEAPFEQVTEDVSAGAAVHEVIEDEAELQPAAYGSEYAAPAEEELLSPEPEEITYELASETPDPGPDDEASEESDGLWDAFVDPDPTEELSVLDASAEFNGQIPEFSNEIEEFTDDAISVPMGNPFDADKFKSEPSSYDTVISVSPETYDAVKDEVPVSGDEPFNGTFFNVPFDNTLYSGTIPMPENGLDPLVQASSTGFETRIAAPSAEPLPVSTTTQCPFCSTENDVQAIACNGCLAVLTLADLELILANHHADKDLLARAVVQLESERSARQLTEAELTTLGIGHLNLRNLQEGHAYLLEAAQKNPDNVVLSSQANALLIRLEEIRQQSATHESMVKGKTILVVDDSPTVRKLIAGKLEKSGHAVVCCGDGIEAMSHLSTLRPDLILLDITMPRMDGYQVCKLIRGDAETKDTPVVMISGKDGFFDKVRGRMAGCSGYITKPFGPETLMKAVESYLNPEA